VESGIGDHLGSGIPTAHGSASARNRHKTSQSILHRARLTNKELTGPHTRWEDLIFQMKACR
jgi:hypothetical protein